MSKRKDAERYFAQSLRNVTFEPEVETNYTRLCKAKHAAKAANAVGATWFVFALVVLVVAVLGECLRVL